MAKPKLALVPAAQGSKFYSVLPSSGVGDFNFTRSGSATRINSQGLIETVGNGVSRLNYPMIDGVVSGCPHHILEPTRTNLVTYSEDFSDSSWNVFRGSVTSNVAISPDGTLNASRYQEDSQTGKHLFRRQSLSIINGLSYTGSIFAKKGELTSIDLQSNSSSRWVASASFDLENGVVISGTGVIEDYGNGWYRCSISGNAVQTTPDAGLEIYTSVGIGRDGDGLFMYGAMFEQSSFPTSYIPTNGGTVTRSAETANGSGDASTFNDSEGVFMAEISIPKNSTEVKQLSLNNGNTNEAVKIVQLSDGTTFRFEVNMSSGSNFREDIIVNPYETNKLALQYKANEYKVFINGIKQTVVQRSNLPIGLNTISFNRGIASTDDFYGKTKQIQYYNSALTDSELETLTSWVSFQDMAEGQLYTIE